MEKIKTIASIITTKGSLLTEFGKRQHATAVEEATYRGNSWAYTWSPGESSVYNLSIVPLDPLAPAALAELGF